MPQRCSSYGARRDSRMLEGRVVRKSPWGSRKRGQCLYDALLLELETRHGSWRDAFSVSSSVVYTKNLMLWTRIRRD
eukprot:IDg21371t1